MVYTKLVDISVFARWYANEYGLPNPDDAIARDAEKRFFAIEYRNSREEIEVENWYRSLDDDPISYSDDEYSVHENGDDPDDRNGGGSIGVRTNSRSSLAQIQDYSDDESFSREIGPRSPIEDSAASPSEPTLNCVDTSMLLEPMENGVTMDPVVEEEEKDSTEASTIIAGRGVEVQPSLSLDDDGDDEYWLPKRDIETQKKSESTEEGEIVDSCPDTQELPPSCSKSSDSVEPQSNGKAKAKGIEVITLEEEDERVDQDSTIEYQSIEAVKSRSPRKFSKYISLDELENADNDNPEWEEVKILRTDFDRKRFAMHKFGNGIEADPSRNLTFHGYLRRNIAKDANFKLTFRRPPMSMKLKLENGILTDLDREKRDRHKVGQKRKASSDSSMCPPAKRVRFDNLETKMIQAISRHKSNDRADGYSNSKYYYLRHYKAGLKETKNFLKYYEASEGENDSAELTVTAKVVEQVLETEAVYQRFVEIYGKNVNQHCKECSLMDGRPVKHPY